MVARQGTVQVSWERGAWEPAGAGVLGSLGAHRQGQDTGTVNRGVLLVLLMACGSEDQPAAVAWCMRIVLLPIVGRESGAGWGREQLEGLTATQHLT